MSNALKSAGRRLAVSAATQVGRRTESRRVLPTMLIVGAQRCGTTTLFKALSQHPAFIGPTLRKGVHYFDLHAEEPLSWYQGHFPTRARIETLSRELDSDIVIGESSPYYLWHPLAAERIAAALPDVKLVALLRDPVERAYSAHAHELARGFETESFEKALELEPARLTGESSKLQSGQLSRSLPHQHLAYLRRGEYIDQLERIERLFGRQRMLVLDSADLWEAPSQHWPALADFLGLPQHDVLLKQHNARSRSPMSPDLRTRLASHFAPFDERLAHWWGRTPSWRR